MTRQPSQEDTSTPNVRAEYGLGVDGGEALMPSEQDVDGGGEGVESLPES